MLLPIRKLGVLVDNRQDWALNQQRGVQLRQLLVEKAVEC